MKVNGNEFSSGEYNIKNNMYIFILNNNNKPLLIMACKKKDLDLIDFIDDFFKIKKKEERLLKYSILFENVYFSKNFSQNTLTKKTTTFLRNLYLKHNDCLNFGWEYERMYLGIKNVIKYDKEIYKTLKLNNGLKYK